jgi:CubicO group peptidase (beta-lactamase class C family)
MKIRHFLFTLPFLLAVGYARADKVDEYLQKLMAEKEIPGLQIGIFKNGMAVKAKGFGLTQLENGKPVDERTLFNIGSVTKQFTSAAVMLLQEEGRLSVEDSIRKHLPELSEAFEGIKIRHILSHTAGLGDYNSVPGFEFHGQSSEAEFLSALAKTKPSRPGEKYAYSNIGYTLVGVLVHRASNSPFEEFVSKRIFGPLKMADTAFIQPERWPDGAAMGYNLAGNEKRPGNIRRNRLSAPSGAIVTNVLDLAKWDAALRNETLLKNSSKEAMWTSAPLSDGKSSNYVFGWSLQKTAAGSFVSHTGATAAGFRAAIVRQLDGPYSAAIMVNLGAELSLTNVLNECVKLWKMENPDPGRQEAIRLRSWISANCTLR